MWSGTLSLETPPLILKPRLLVQLNDGGKIMSGLMGGGGVFGYVYVVRPNPHKRKLA